MRSEKAYLDVEKLRGDMQALGINGKQLSEAMGKTRNYIAVLMTKQYIGTEVISRIEKQMFQKPGAYTLPVGKAPEVKKKPDKAGVEERLDKLESAFVAFAEMQVELLKEIIETQKQTNTQIMKLRSLTERVWDKG